MEEILRPLYQERSSHAGTLGVILVEKYQNESPSTDMFDHVVLIVTEDAQTPIYTKHYSYEDKKAALHIVSEEQLRNWLLLGSNRKIVDWIYNGKIVFERNDYFSDLRQELHDFPLNGRKIKKGIEFAKLIRRYADGKMFFENNQLLDAYNHIVHALHHLARLAIIDKGFHPEVTVWNQVKQIEPEIYKLYEELLCSTESLQQRLQLSFLASDFAIYSRIETGAEHLLDIMQLKDGYWSFDELSDHPEIVHYNVDLSVLIEYLIMNNKIEVVCEESKGTRLLHRYYKNNKEIQNIILT